jgi:dihydroneopterin aldolase
MRHHRPVPANRPVNHHPLAFSGIYQTKFAKICRKSYDGGRRRNLTIRPVAKSRRHATATDVRNANGDAIHIEQLELLARIGVTDTERAKPQRLTASITIWPKSQFEFLSDDLARTIDYSTVCMATREFVATRSDKLIETLAAALAEHLLHIFPIQEVRLDVRKFVLADANYAAAVVTRSASIG